jgi:hypothetical protein
MIKIVLAFIIVFGLFFLGIKTIRNLTGKEALALTKIAGYSILCAVLTFVVLISIVVIF